jgi:DNA replication and repair protein RecF
LFVAQQNFQKAVDDVTGTKSDSLYNLVLKGSEGKFGVVKIADEYSGTDAGNLANYYAGIAYLNTKKYAEAITSLEKFSSDDIMLSTLGQAIFEKRKNFLADFIPIFNQYHQDITNSAETVQLVYQSDLSENDTLALLEQNLQKDRALQYTSVGVHKDDLSFEIDNHPIKKFGSQGQQKSFLIALKLAQFDFVKKQSGEKPILLFDDIFDKLDEFRVSKIIQMVNNDEFGQLFISDTHPERTENIVKTTHQSYKIFNL